MTLAAQDTIVLDTNTILSSLISPRGPAAMAVATAFETHEVVQSPDTIAELRRKLSSPKLAAFIDPDLADIAFGAFVNSVTVVDAAHNVELCRDKDDNKFLDVAVAAQASVVVSGDRDLLTLKEVHGIGHWIDIITPQQYVTAVESMSGRVTPRPQNEFASLLSSMRHAPKPH
jgi:putative PIN family toxin of toxin-antitoxin system